MTSRVPSLVRPLCLAIVAATAASSAVAGDLIGRVSDTRGETGISGAAVELPGLNRRTTTDSSGTFRVGDLPAGEHQVILRYPGAETYIGKVEVATEGTVRFEARLQPAVGYTEEMLIIGQRAAQASALSQQRQADTISSFLTRDAIGQFPDQNVTEAVRRLSGVSVQNDQGEGRFIVLRGLDPNLNSASVNGVRIMAPESDIRAVALDVVPAELVESIELQKSLIPEMDADAIGGAIDIRTTSALDRKGPFLSVTGSGSYNDLVEEWSPKFGVDASTVINDRIGISVGLSYFERSLGSDNMESDDWTDEDGIVYAESLEFREYIIDRTRIGATLGLDFVVNDTTTLYARGVYSEFEDYEFRYSTELDFGDAAPVSGGADSATFNLSGDEELEVVRAIKDRKETQTIESYQFGGETFVNRWSFEYQAAYTHAEEYEPFNPDTTDFARTYEAGELALTQRATASDIIRLDIASGSLAAFTDASSYEFDQVEIVNGKAEDDEYSVRLDVGREMDAGTGVLELKTGFRGRWREKNDDLNLGIYDGFEGSGDFLLSQVVGGVDYPLNPIEPVALPGPTRDLLGNLSNFELNEAETLFENEAASYEVEETILAGYLQARYENGPLRIIGGLRVEATDNEVLGNRVELVEEGATVNGEVLGDDTTFVTPVRFTKSDTQYLPSINLRYEASEDLILRAAAYASMFRPNMKDLAPRFIVEQDDGDEREGEFGNPDLEPFTAQNFDAGVEWYFAENAVLQAGVFYKSIDDFIFRSILEDVDFNGVFVNEGVIPLNGDTADVTGFELNYQNALVGLPAPFDGLIVGANYTYVDTEADIGDRTTTLPGTSENVANLVLGYEKGPISVRLAWVYRDEYIDELSSDGESDRFVKEHDQFDLTARYDVSDSFQLFLEAINLTDEPYVVVARTPDYGDRLLQYEEYSFTVNLGIKATF